MGGIGDFREKKWIYRTIESDTDNNSIILRNAKPTFKICFVCGHYFNEAPEGNKDQLISIYKKKIRRHNSRPSHYSLPIIKDTCPHLVPGTNKETITI